MPTSPHPRLTRALRATCLFALCAALAVVGLPSEHGHPPERVAASTSSVPAYGPTTDRRAELVAGIGRAQLAAFYAWASSQPTTTIATPTTSTTKSTNAAPEPSGDALTAIAAHFGDLYNQAVGIARCESTLNPGAVSRDGRNWGLFQINVVHRGRLEAMGYSWSQILDADVNASVARAIYDDNGGWSSWSCKP